MPQEISRRRAKRDRLQPFIRLIELFIRLSYTAAIEFCIVAAFKFFGAALANVDAIAKQQQKFCHRFASTSLENTTNRSRQLLPDGDRPAEEFWMMLAPSARRLKIDSARFLVCQMLGDRMPKRLP